MENIEVNGVISDMSMSATCGLFNRSHPFVIIVQLYRKADILKCYLVSAFFNIHPARVNYFRLTWKIKLVPKYRYENVVRQIIVETRRIQTMTLQKLLLIIFSSK